jgi:hemerythrin
MPNKKWDDTYATGIYEIDDAHKNLITIINKIYRLFIEGKYDNSEYSEILNSLNDYVAIHFAYEDTWMLENGYPNRYEHILDHKRFSKKVSEMVENVTNGKGRLTIDILSFLKVWLLTHIAVVDSDLGVFSRASAERGNVVGL